MPAEALSDEQIVARVVAGEVDLFEELVTRHRDAVFALLSRRLPSAEVAGVAHEVFVSAWESLPRFEPRAPFVRWLTRLALRRSHDHWRRNYADARRRAPLDEATLLSQLDEAAARTERRLDNTELVQRLLEHLDVDDRSVITLLHLDERPVAEVAEVLGWSQDKVKTRASRARRLLRDRLGADFGLRSQGR